MDIRQGKIRNLNKRLFVGMLSFTLISSTIVGCSVSNHIKLERQRYENFTGVASLEKLKKSFFVEIYDRQDDTTKYYIASKNPFFNTNGDVVGYTYLDLLDRKNVFVDRIDNSGNNVNFTQYLDKTIINEVNLEEYLYNFKIIESMYSTEDIENLLGQMKKIDFEDKNKTK